MTETEFNAPFAVITTGTARANDLKFVMNGGPTCTIDRTFTLAFSLDQ